MGGAKRYPSTACAKERWVSLRSTHPTKSTPPHSRGAFRPGFANRFALNISTRFTARHHVLGAWPEESFELWIGIVVSQSEPGRKPSSSPKLHSEALHFAEHATAFFVETSENERKVRSTSENERKVRSPPKRSGILFNRWFMLESNWPRHGKRPQPNWPDFIEYDKEEGTGRNVYFGGRVEKWPAD